MDIISPRDLGIAVRNARQSRKLTQAALAQQAGVSRDWLIRLEQGRTGLELGKVFAVLAAVGIVLHDGRSLRDTSAAASVDDAATILDNLTATLSRRPT